MNKAPGSGFTRLYSLCNLQMGPISLIVILHCARKAYHGQRIQLTWPIRKLRSKVSVVNTALEACTIKLYGRNLRIL
jgi:hypothetical protein